MAWPNPTFLIQSMTQSYIFTQIPHSCFWYITSRCTKVVKAPAMSGPVPSSHLTLRTAEHGLGGLPQPQIPDAVERIKYKIHVGDIDTIIQRRGRVQCMPLIVNLLLTTPSPRPPPAFPRSRSRAQIGKPHLLFWIVCIKMHLYTKYQPKRY